MGRPLTTASVGLVLYPNPCELFFVGMEMLMLFLLLKLGAQSHKVERVEQPETN